MGIVKKIINASYNTRMRLSKITGMGISSDTNEKNIKPPVSFYSLEATNNKGVTVSFEQFRGKNVLIVNLASECGFTPQYSQLEELHQLHNNNLAILGFPSNDFGAQEPGSDEEIENFCKVNFGVTFPLFKKDHVKGEKRQPVYDWLSNSEKNGWNDNGPTWNFNKFLIDENGSLQKVFSASVSPNEILKCCD